MSVIHVCNSFFELELESSISPLNRKSLLSQARLNPMVMQLQFLPLIYAGKEDLILVSDLPENPDPRLQLMDSEVKAEKIEHWGPSLCIADWANLKKIAYSIPDWDVVCTVNSKVFSFTKGFQLTGSALLHNEKEALAWIEKTPDPKIMKTAFGFSGKGHYHFGRGKDLLSYLRKEFSQNRPIIGEPWVERVLDFSTQWYLSPGKIELLGSTQLENRSDGSYLATVAGRDLGRFEWALEEHLSVAYPLLEEILNLGFFGNLGIDAFVYLDRGRKKVHPMVEINGRKTMGWLALHLQQREYPEKILRLSLEKGRMGPLPTRIYVDGEPRLFTHQLGQKLWNR